MLSVLVADDTRHGHPATGVVAARLERDGWSVELAGSHDIDRDTVCVVIAPERRPDTIYVQSTGGAAYLTMTASPDDIAHRLRELTRDPACFACAGHGVAAGHARAVLEIVADILPWVIEDTRERARKDAQTDNDAERLYNDADRADYAATVIDAWLNGTPPTDVPPPDPLPIEED